MRSYTGLYTGAIYTAYRRAVEGLVWHKCRCGALIPMNIPMCTSCAAGESRQPSRHMEYNRYRRDKKAAGFYVSRQWRETRADALRLYDGIDIYAYYVQHRIITADMVHHVTEIEDDWNRRLDMTNLLPLSNSNHGIISALYDKDEQSKRDTQRMLYGLIAAHWEAAGGIQKVLNGAG